MSTKFGEAPSPKGLNISVIHDNALAVTWISEAALSLITFAQINKKDKLVKKQFIASNYAQHIDIMLYQFADFDDRNILVNIRHANSFDGCLNSISSPFSIGQDRLFFAALIRFQLYPKYLKNSHEFFNKKYEVKKPYKVPISLKVKVENYYYILSTSNNSLAKVTLQNQNSNSLETFNKDQSHFTLDLYFETPGTYLVQIFTISCLKVASLPFYVGSGIPMIPSYENMLQMVHDGSVNVSQVEIQQRYVGNKSGMDTVIEPSLNSSIEEKRQYLLNLMNAERQKSLYQPLRMSAKLNQFAQNHTQNMLANSYLSSTNLEGQTLSQRAKKRNITAYINQDIKTSSTLNKLYIHAEFNLNLKESFMNKSSQNVGFGIAMNTSDKENPYYIITMVYTSRDLQQTPLIPTQFQQYRQKLIKALIQKNPNIKQNSALTSDIEKWSAQYPNENESNLSIYLSKKGYKNLKVISQKILFNNYDEEIQKIAKDNKFVDSNVKYVGVGLKGDGKAMMVLFVVFVQ